LTRQTPSLRAALQRPLLPPPLMHRRSPGASTAHSGSGRARSGSQPALVLGACSCGWLKALVTSRQPSATPSMSPITSTGHQRWQPNSSGKHPSLPSSATIIPRLLGACSQCHHHVMFCCTGNNPVMRPCKGKEHNRTGLGLEVVTSHVTLQAQAAIVLIRMNS
jgi:hypothetical protein